MPMFQDEIRSILDKQSTVEESAERLYDALTPHERLFMLDGDETYISLGVRFALGAKYCCPPHAAGQIARLGIPGIHFSDGPRGIIEGTAFPTPSARAASWDPDLEEEIGEAIGNELRAIGGNYFGGVCVNLAPNPNWGRLQESYGEDPLLIGSFGAALSRGVGKNAIACVKHFALNSIENLRFSVNVEVEQDILHECYLPHFRQCLDEGGAESIMSAYNAVNGTICGDNKALLNGILRDTWGCEDVIVTSDWVLGMRNAARSVEAGLDIEMPCRSVRAKHLAGELGAGDTNWSTVERISKRLLRCQLKLYLRLDNSPAPSKDIVRCAEHRALARRAAAGSMVLLKNDDGFLPLNTATTRRLLVIGSLAKSTQTGDDGSSHVRDPDVISPLEGLRARKDVEITYLDGTDLGAIDKACAASDAVFLLVGLTSYDEGEYLGPIDAEVLHTVMPGIFTTLWIASFWIWIFKIFLPVIEIFTGKIQRGGDRQTLRLSQAHETLAQTVANIAGPKLVLGVEASGPIILPQSVRQQTASILLTGYGGSQFGPALGDVLFGDAEPSGRLAYGIVESEDHLPDIDMNSNTVSYGRFWGYRWTQKIQKLPAYPFGFGLGYGNAEIIKGSLSTRSIIKDRFFDVELEVVNTGTKPTTAVIQIYCGRAGVLERNDYERVLIGFARSHELVPGSHKPQKVAIRCRLDPVAHWMSAKQEFKVGAGHLKIFASKYEGDPHSEETTIETPGVQWGVKVKP